MARVDRLRFLERVSDAYFLVGWEYYTLAKTAEDQGDLKKRREYATKADLYHALCEELKRTAWAIRGQIDPDHEQSPAARSEE